MTGELVISRKIHCMQNDILQHVMEEMASLKAGRQADSHAGSNLGSKGTLGKSYTRSCL